MSDYPNARDCEHGAQRGQCELCERDARNVILQGQVDDLRAEVEAMREVCEAAIKQLELVEKLTGPFDPLLDDWTTATNDTEDAARRYAAAREGKP